MDKAYLLEVELHLAELVRHTLLSRPLGPGFGIQDRGGGRCLARICSRSMEIIVRPAKSWLPGGVWMFDDDFCAAKGDQCEAS